MTNRSDQIKALRLARIPAPEMSGSLTAELDQRFYRFDTGWGAAPFRRLFGAPSRVEKTEIYHLSERI